MSFSNENGNPYKQDAHDIPIPPEYAGLEAFGY